MIYIRQFAILAAIGLASARFYNDNQEHLRAAWEGFKRDFSRVYHPSEETYRFAVFVKNLQLIDERNSLELENGGSAVHGITRFADLTPEEFRQQFLGSVLPTIRQEREVVTDVPEALTSSKDWAGVLTTPVKNQGQCGSCWAFSATEQIESDTIRTLGKTYVLSPQQIVSCDGTSFGCNGGWTEHAYNYVKRAGGLSSESSYPYTAPPTGSCSANSANFQVTVDSYTTISGEPNMANYVLGTGPLSVCLDADNWSSYTGGILSVCGKNVDHCVQAVGVDNASNGYWKVRNSWGVTWGESGYIRLAYGKDTCHITSDPTYTKVHLV